MGVQLMMMMLVTLTYKDRSTQQEIYVNEGLTRNLLGLPAITELQIIARLDAVSDVRSTIMESYPKLFTGLGNFGNPHEINLKKDAVPFALNTPRRIPLALRDQVKAELQRMENLGVISPVVKKQPTKKREARKRKITPGGDRSRGGKRPQFQQPRPAASRRNADAFSDASCDQTSSATCYPQTARSMFLMWSNGTY